MRRLTTAFAAVVALTVGGVAAPVSAQAATSGCVSDIGKRTPVILVHGFASSPQNAWSVMKPYINKHAKNVYVETFDYSQDHYSWVDNKNIGPKLAKRIACVAASSKAAGGVGQVVVVGHSMGGLATRWAATKASNAKEVASDLGLVVTIGTPNTGSGLGNTASALKYSLCNTENIGQPEPAGSPDSPCNVWDAVDGLAQSSDDLKKLPYLPKDVPLKALAGDVTVTLGLFKARVHQDLGADVVVGKDSALEKHAHAGQGGGTLTVSCSTAVKDAINTSKTPCWHSGLTSNPKVMQEVVDSIGGFQSAQLLKPYVGDWGFHASGFNITPDGDGTFTFRDYNDTCPAITADNFYVCNVHAQISVKATDKQSATMTIVSSYTIIKDNKGNQQRKVTIKPGTKYHLGAVDAKNGQVPFDFGGRSDFYACRPGGIADNANVCGV